jgi:hypothetical protein
LHGFADNDGADGIDPLGLETGKGGAEKKPCCCCCVTRVSATMERIKSLPVAGGGHADVMGHTIRLSIKLEMKEDPTGNGYAACSYKWVENTDNVPLENKKKCKANTPCDITDLFPDRFPFKPPDTPGAFPAKPPDNCRGRAPLEDEDNAYIETVKGKPRSRKMTIDVTVSSGAGCQGICEHAKWTLRITQHLRWDGKTRHWDVEQKDGPTSHAE